MARLIDADALANWIDGSQRLDKEHDYEEVARYIEECPTVDAVEVVRCSECKHKGWIQDPCHGKSIDYCRQLERPVDKQFFCGLGERKGGDSDG